MTMISSIFAVPKINWVKRKAYLKVHMSVNVRNKKIFSMKVTDEHAHDGKVLPELVDDIKKPDEKTTVCKLFADGGTYDGNDVFRCLSDNGILPCIKTRKNARIKLKTNHILRNLSVIEQRNGLQGWRDSVGCGCRWTAETVFTSIKRTFDIEYVFILSSLKIRYRK
jgi:hypothetical protein